METNLQVYIDLEGETHLVGKLWARSARGKEGATFEYARAWLDNPLHFALEPALALGKGPQHTLEGRALFGALGDSAPDRWGRLLIQREERRQAREQRRGARMRVLPNPMNKFLLNRESGLRYAPDGSLTLHFGPERPTDAPEENWLPTFGGKNYRFTFRFYGPKGGVADGSYYPPPILKS